MSILRQFIQEAESMASAELANNVVSFREARAKRIKELALHWTDSSLQLGKELLAAMETFPTEEHGGAVPLRRPGWAAWVEANCGFNSTRAGTFIRIWKTFGSGATGIAPVGSSVLLEFLARETTPEEVRQEIIERTNAGEVIGRGKAEKIAKQHTAPPPEEARKIAKETGKPTLARDGNIYLGATKEQEKQTEARREMVFGVRRAIDALAAVNVTPGQFLNHALPHQLWTATEEHVLDEALDWLTELKAAWESR